MEYLCLLRFYESVIICRVLETLSPTSLILEVVSKGSAHSGKKKRKLWEGDGSSQGTSRNTKSNCRITLGPGNNLETQN